MKITQIEPSTVQTAREGNKRRTYVNIQVQTADAIVTRILSKLLADGEEKEVVEEGEEKQEQEQEERKKEEGVLMNITLQSKSDHDVSDGKRVSARKTKSPKTPSDNVTFTETNAFDSNGHGPRIMTPTMSRIVQCFVCSKRHCYM
ncbi:hypothetical protein EAI_14075 [Harpegnathos saltator]|uniref:Uncharacterized protein n=1 Tax=Harpegnathos saltator TaxID=610380 RepID=E2C7Y3_HARSA|nr:hypothetical protein EAI_14075 [Harpegnathos saltator]